MRRVSRSAFSFKSFRLHGHRGTARSPSFSRYPVSLPRISALFTRTELPFVPSAHGPRASHVAMSSPGDENDGVLIPTASVPSSLNVAEPPDKLTPQRERERESTPTPPPLGERPANGSVSGDVASGSGGEESLSHLVQLEATRTFNAQSDAVEVVFARVSTATGRIVNPFARCRHRNALGFCVFHTRRFVPPIASSNSHGCGQSRRDWSRVTNATRRFRTHALLCYSRCGLASGRRGYRSRPNASGAGEGKSANFPFSPPVVLRQLAESLYVITIKVQKRVS